ncbi:TRAP transporter small permease subunit [Agathobaculum sp. NTUH-O15-33]|uniref:TRAP transporter small permease n=1 Tax=Agathobaculum sp. NTUH-O15-33 TaxID=3079302 RepID=UPI0029584B5D|nr:TRAP transporter small permease subunit [Agathobaculum sp. NTUH-O15-33]WNX84529.1 TRAP transporter small permease subunit [Agathobaculum sp. NTUH-O15-33]
MLDRLDNIFVKIERTICVITFLAMVAVVLWSVLCRRVLMIPFLAGEELTRYLAIYSIFFGTSVAVKEKGTRRR